MNYKKIVEQLKKENMNKCNICGREFSEECLPEIDHIIPVSLGGSDDINNLQLVCSFCNRRKGNKIVYEQLFEMCIKKIVKKSNKYEMLNIRKFKEFEPDIFLKSKKKEEYLICEIKAGTVYTDARLDIIGKRLKESKDRIKNLYSNIKTVFIFPGTLSTSSMNIINQYGIIVWDREYLLKEFKNEIIELNNLYFNSILKTFEYKPKKLVNIYQDKIDKLKECKPGKENWSEYQKLIGEILELLFCPPLTNPIDEKYDERKINRRDFIMPNYSANGFWKFVREKYCADFIVIDAKNSAQGIKKQDILQVSNYLKQHGTGLFGIIIARKYNEKRMYEMLSQIWQLENKMIIIINDNDIEQMLIEKMNGGEPEKLIREKIEDFRLLI